MKLNIPKLENIVSSMQYIPDTLLKLRKIRLNKNEIVRYIPATILISSAAAVVALLSRDCVINEQLKSDPTRIETLSSIVGYYSINSINKAYKTDIPGVSSRDYCDFGEGIILELKDGTKLRYVIVGVTPTYQLTDTSQENE